MRIASRVGVATWSPDPYRLLLRRASPIGLPLSIADFLLISRSIISAFSLIEPTLQHLRLAQGATSWKSKPMTQNAHIA